MPEESTLLLSRGESTHQQHQASTYLHGAPSPAPNKLLPGPPWHTQGGRQDAAQGSLASPLHADLPVATLADVQVVEVPAVVRWVTASEDYFPTGFRRGIPRVQNTAE